MSASRGPLSAAADEVAEDLVTGADGVEDAAEEEPAAEQPATREATDAARPSLRAERELCNLTAFLSAGDEWTTNETDQPIRGDRRQQITCELDTQAV
jgi:hypothetical protein